MSYSYDKFLRPITSSDKSIKILDNTNDIKYTIDPFVITNVAVTNNILRISLKSLRVILLNFSTKNEAKIALTRLQQQIDTLTTKVPILIDKDIQNYIQYQIEQIGIIVGPTGPQGVTGSIGPQGVTGSADRYAATSSTTLETPVVGEVVDLVTQTDLAYTTAQNVVIYSDLPNLYNSDYETDGSYFIGQIDYYDTQTGDMSLVTTFSSGSGTYSFWYLNLSGMTSDNSSLDLTSLTTDIIPAVDSLYSLGTSASQWKSLHVSGQTIYIGGVPLSTDGNSLVVNSINLGTTASPFILSSNNDVLLLNGITGSIGATGPTGPAGVDGLQGPTGPAGTSLNILGSLTDYNAFINGPGATNGVNTGDSWILLSDGSLYIWNGTNWFDAGDLKGPKGDQGEMGNQGPIGPTGSQGIQGSTGPAGPQGSAGASVTLLGSYVDVTSFNLGAGSASGINQGDSYIILDTGSLYTWSASSSVWFNAGDIKGPAGPQGPQGPQGIQGVAGIPGTNGLKGATGPQGIQGAQGVQGATGPSGSSGLVAYTLPDTFFNPNTWILLGTWNTAQTGHTLRMKLSAHAGYNAGFNQNQATDLYFAVSNGISTNPSAVGGSYYANGSAFRNEYLGTASTAPSLFRVVQSNINTYLFYGNFGQWAGNSHYTISISGTTSWSHSGVTGSTPSGTYLDITPTSSGSGNLYFLEATTANITYTLPGGFVEDPCRYSIVSAAVNVSSSWFDTSAYTFTPQKAGYWEITASYDIYRNTEASMAIEKNNAVIAVAGSFNAVVQTVTRIIYLNGSTDYINIFNTGGAAFSRSQSASRSWFQARWVGE